MRSARRLCDCSSLPARARYALANGQCLFTGDVLSLCETYVLKTVYDSILVQSASGPKYVTGPKMCALSPR